MEHREYLTNEAISKRFDNQFDLVNYTIKLAAELVKSGRAPRVKIKTENPALQILEEVICGVDGIEEEKVVQHSYYDIPSMREKAEEAAGTLSE